MSLLRSIAALTLAGSLLAGCSGSPMGTVAVATGVADFASLNATKKTLGDHVATGIVGRDCSSVTFEQTGSYCPEQVVVDRSNVYCYRTLADVDCHYLPDPYRNGQTALASPPPVRKPVERKGWFE
ncbi:MAG TPA: hypothetical protein VD978_14885 [Azospirillum sp.]|nr:hypothetical protein [Azospirillum sp.]